MHLFMSWFSTSHHQWYFVHERVKETIRVEKELLSQKVQKVTVALDQ